MWTDSFRDIGRYTAARLYNSHGTAVTCIGTHTFKFASFASSPSSKYTRDMASATALPRSMKPYYGPDENEQTINLERFFIAGDFVSGVGYGVHLVLWSSCALYLWKQRRRSWMMQALLGYISLLFAVETIFSIVQARTVQLVYIENRNYPGGPWSYFLATQSQPVNVIFYACIFVTTFLCDALMLWRNWVIWTAASSGRITAYVVNTFPLITLTASFVMGTLWTLQSSHPGLSMYSKQPMAYGTAYYTLSLGTNVVLTILIIMRLLTYRRALLEHLPSAHSQHYVSLISIIVESAALYSVFAVAFLVSYAINAPINQMWLAFAVSAQPIATYLIIYRVADGQAWSSQTLSSQTMSAVVFTPNSKSATLQPKRSTEGVDRAAGGDLRSLAFNLQAENEELGGDGIDRGFDSSQSIGHA
ncbi:hypothetical protein NUW54_g1477 [Trametes sanguinea]|uniref:Uncharacterized protein n=1 Tax=Trametes sanguinea TaxID=158606 RepID=A0ACC1Q694_9APHY|nr:hypothetical protein NUW54_g1477 [Trametes sanguinea]